MLFGAELCVRVAESLGKQIERFLEFLLRRLDPESTGPLVGQLSTTERFENLCPKNGER